MCRCGPVSMHHAYCWVHTLFVQDDSDDEGDKIGSLFQKAKAIGAQQGTADDLPTQGMFAGQGRTLAGGAQVGVVMQACSWVLGRGLRWQPV